MGSNKKLQENLPSQSDIDSARNEALDSLGRVTDAYTVDGERSHHDHTSGAPEKRDLVLGEDDPRDKGLEETINSEDVVYTGTLFNVDKLTVTLPNGSRGERDVVRHPAPSPSSR